MNICVCGWYFRPKFMEAVRDSGFPAFVVKHRYGDDHGIPSANYPNLGLEFGAYRQYVENHWDGKSDVLFIHDDVDVIDTFAFAEIERLKGMGLEHAYIFSSDTEVRGNFGVHGRAMWMRADIIKKLAGNFPADMDNAGDNMSKTAQEGIMRFHHRITKCGENTAAIAIVPWLRFGFRGLIHDEMFVYKQPKTEMVVA